MRILHVTDLHSHFEKLNKVLLKENFDLVIISGDVTHFGGAKQISEITPVIERNKASTLLVTGNCDYPECMEITNQLNISVENNVILKNNIQFVGLGGSLPCPRTTPNEYSEEEYEFQLNKLAKLLSNKLPIVLISHQPPIKTLNDKVLLGFHVGSKAVRKFIEDYEPLLCLTGHIHEGKGIDSIGSSIIVNPGPIRNNHYAIIEINATQPPLVQLF